MKRFKWRLERVLDIALQQEKALKAEIFAIAAAMVRLREAILARQTRVRSWLAELARLAFPRRLREQAMFMQYSASHEREIQRLRGDLDNLAVERRAKTDEFIQSQARRKTLERLRAEAAARYMREARNQEQGQFDESAHIAYARQADPRYGPNRTGAGGEEPAADPSPSTDGRGPCVARS